VGFLCKLGRMGIRGLDGNTGDELDGGGIMNVFLWEEAVKNALERCNLCTVIPKRHKYLV